MQNAIHDADNIFILGNRYNSLFATALKSIDGSDVWFRSIEATYGIGSDLAWYTDDILILSGTFDGALYFDPQKPLQSDGLSVFVSALSTSDGSGLWTQSLSFEDKQSYAGLLNVAADTSVRLIGYTRTSSLETSTFVAEVSYAQ
ncbi:MAG: hypothetical protein IPJ88_04625 [Myxococcales bacterium]|nr:MAG: hypothetical protein IPJ88_04625 [Myxococcales bacterium]